METKLFKSAKLIGFSSKLEENNDYYFKLCELQKWMLERHKIYVIPVVNIFTKKFSFEGYDFKDKIGFENENNCDNWKMKTYDEALAAGLSFIIDGKIKEKNGKTHIV